MSDESAWLEAVQPPPDGELVVAVSGGPDSAFLAWAMAQLGGDPRLVHVHHGTPAADLLAAACRELADHLRLPLRIVEVTVPDGPSWEDQARRVRSEALRSVAGEAPVATGHHRDDQAETLVGNLLRGAGARGLAGMYVSRPGWLRPLLRMRRTEIRSAVTGLGLPFVDDPANLDESHRRNMIRHRVLPLLEETAPGAAERIATASELLAADDLELQRMSSEVSCSVAAGRAVLSVHELRVVPFAVAARAIRRAIRALDGVYPGSSGDVSAVLGVVRGRTTRTTIVGGIDVTRDRALLLLTGPGVGAVPWEAIELPIPGRVVAGERWVSASPAETDFPVGPRRAIVATSALADPVLVRPVRSGDRIDIGEGSKLVSDALREAAVGVHRRAMWPLVDAGGRIAWLAGVRVAAWAAPQSDEPATMLETGVI